MSLREAIEKLRESQDDLKKNTQTYSRISGTGLPSIKPAKRLDAEGEGQPYEQGRTGINSTC